MKRIRHLLALLFCAVMLLSVAAPASFVTQVQAASSSKIVLNKTKATVYNGKTLKLKVKNTKQKVTWSTSNKKIATVKNGVVTPKKVGTVTIKAAVGKKTLKCKVTVKPALKVSATQLTIAQGKAKKVKVTLYLEDANLACKIGKPSVASYKIGKRDGKKIVVTFTAKKAGKTRATISNTRTKDVCKITLIVPKPEVKPAPQPLQAAADQVTLDLKETKTVILTAVPQSEIVVSVAQPTIARCTWSGTWNDTKTSVSLTGLANGTTTVTLTHAQSGQQVTLPITVGCVHTFSEDPLLETAPTCTSPGSAFYYCTKCGIRGESKELPALGHNYDEAFTVDVPSTCSKEGVQSRHCLVCGAKTDEKPLERAPHDYGGFTILKEASCTETGSKTRLCRRCGAQDNLIIPKLPHTCASWTQTKAASCKEAGEETGVCTVCGETVTREIEKLPHSFSTEFTVDKEATCGENGSKSRHCTVCGEKSEITEIPATNEHSFGDWAVTKEATCTAAGEETATCTVCGETKTREIEKLPHTFSTEFTVDKEATCVENGSKSRHCTVCGEQSEITEIPATNEHSYGDWMPDGDKESRTCSVCGHTEIRDPLPAPDAIIPVETPDDNTQTQP